MFHLQIIGVRLKTEKDFEGDTLPSRNGTESGDKSERVKVEMPGDLTDLARKHSKILVFVLPLQSKLLQAVDTAMA